MKYFLCLFVLCSSLAAQEQLMVEKIERNELEWSKVVQEHILHLIDNDREFLLPAGQRVDLFDQFDKISYEVDWAQKWPEGVGQSLIYAIKTNSKPGLILLVKEGDDEHYLNAMTVINDLRRRGYDYRFIVLNVQNLKYWSF